MKFHNVHQICSTELTNIQKCLEIILFMRRAESLFFRKFLLIHFGAKKVFFLSICGCWSNWWKKFGVHCWTSCKIRTQTDKYCGNESKIRLTHKIHRFTPIFLPPELLTKKHAKMGTFLNIFFSLFLTKKFPQLVNSRKKPFPTNSVHKWGHPQSTEWPRKNANPLQFHNGKYILGHSCHMELLQMEWSLLTVLLYYRNNQEFFCLVGKCVRRHALAQTKYMCWCVAGME